MTNRHRFHETMRFGKPDRVPYFEEGIRTDVIETWYRQGLPQEADVSDLFKADPSYEVDLEPLSTSPKKLTFLKKHFSPGNLARFWIIWQKMIRLWRKKDHVLFLRVNRGFFLSMGVYDWRRFTEVILWLHDDPEFVRETMLTQGEYTAKLLNKFLKYLNIDAVIFSEPIGGNEGPLISPAMYEEFVLKSYKPILDVVTKYGIDTIILRTYANIRILIPSILSYGFNCLWACETNSTAMDYRDLRKEFGRDLCLIGGIDLDALRYDKATIRKEIEEKVSPLIASGGFIPLADGRVRKDIPFENYVYYRRLLKQIISFK